MLHQMKISKEKRRQAVTNKIVRMYSQSAQGNVFVPDPIDLVKNFKCDIDSMESNQIQVYLFTYFLNYIHYSRVHLRHKFDTTQNYVFLMKIIIKKSKNITLKIKMHKFCRVKNQQKKCVCHQKGRSQGLWRQTVTIEYIF